MSRFVLVFGAAVLCHASTAHAQLGGLLDRARQKAEEAVERAGEDAAGGVPEEAASPPERVPARRAAPAGEASGGAQSAPGAGAEPAPEVYGNRFDFVPGDKVIVYDDFSDAEVGEYPPRWTMKDGGGNAVEVVQIGGRRFLKSRYQKEWQEASLHWLRYAPKGDMPNKFTLELDADVQGTFSILFSHGRNYGGQEIRLGWERGHVHAENASGKLPVTKGVQHVSIAVSGTQVKVYVGGERVVIDSDGVTRPISRIGVRFEEASEGDPAADHQQITALRLAEGGKDVKTMLVTGRIVTHGILFDSGSDVIKPESGPTLRSILALLQEDRSLAFAIEGHTDGQGGPSVNGPLSDRRARAVKAWLVKQGIEEKRLSPRGLGATKPIDSNDTPEGRANNRRVEFVRSTGSAS